MLDVPAHDDGLAMSRPGQEFVLVRTWRLDSTEALALIRAELVEELSRQGCPPGHGLASTPDKLVLIASELATNALKHGRPPTTVRLLRNAETLLIEVTDRELAKVPRYAGQRVPGAGGVGLHLARQLSLDVGWYRSESAKTVWATFPV